MQRKKLLSNTTWKDRICEADEAQKINQFRTSILRNNFSCLQNYGHKHGVIYNLFFLYKKVNLTSPVTHEKNIRKSKVLNRFIIYLA